MRPRRDSAEGFGLALTLAPSALLDPRGAPSTRGRALHLVARRHTRPHRSLSRRCPRSQPGAFPKTAPPRFGLSSSRLWLPQPHTHPSVFYHSRAQADETPLHKAAYNVFLPVVRAVLEAYPEALHMAQAVRAAPSLPRRCRRPCPHLAPACSSRLQPIPAPHRGVSPSCTTAIRTWPRCCTSARRGSAGSLASLASSPLPGDARVASRPRSERASPGPPSLVQWHPCSAIVQLYDDARDCARTRSYHHGVLHES